MDDSDSEDEMEVIEEVTPPPPSQAPLTSIRHHVGFLTSHACRVTHCL